jgi:Fic family protein
MRKPQPPPPINDLVVHHLTGPVADDFVKRVLGVSVAGERYLPWDELRRRPTPEGFTSEEWWISIKVARKGMQRALPLTDKEGGRLTHALPDDVLRGIEAVDKQTSGRIGVPEPVTHDAPTRDRYVVNSLIEEAITSSQLEGASTTHTVAKDMLRTGRKPRTKSERMILNNYRGMLRVGDVRHEPLTPALICEFHRILTEGTLDDPGACGRIQLPSDLRVVVEDTEGQVLHDPLSAAELPERLQRLCDFANGVSDSAYVPPVVRAIVSHFMLAYDHPFADGNGRTARLLFYWSMLNQDYWLTEFLPISRLLAKAPAQYARSFLHSEQDDGDLTYFILYQLGIIQRAITDLHRYLGRKVAETKRLRQALTAISGHFNHRQMALLEHAIKNPDARYTVASHGGSHNVVPQTARTDLQGLEREGFLTRISSKRGYAWIPSEELDQRLPTTPEAEVRRRRRAHSRRAGRMRSPVER